MKIKNILFLSALFFVSFGFVNSQTVPYFDMPTGPNVSDFVDTNTGLPLGIMEQVSYTTIPKIPSPGDNVSIKAESYSTDLNKAYFIWTENGKVAKEGMGQKDFYFTAPPSGKTTIINLTIRKERGGTIQESFVFSPADVDVIYEADTYVPPFYKGKSLFTSESNVRFIAMPDFVESNVRKNPNNLVYKWSINGTVDNSRSGYGKRVYEMKGGLIQRPMNVEVEVSAPNSNLKAKGSTFVIQTQPEVLIYENNPLLDIVFEKAISGDFVLNRQEIEFQSYPFFFATKAKDNYLVDYVWKMNGQLLPSSSLISNITFRNETGEEGRSVISLDLEHVNNILQVAKGVINLTYKKNEVSNNNNSNTDF